MEGAAQQLDRSPELASKLGVLCDPACVLRVRKGAVDLFLVRVEDGVPVGARRPVSRITAGEVILCPPNDGGYALYGQPAPGTWVERTGWSSLSDDDLTRWTERLGGALGAIRPTNSVDLAPGQQMELDAGATVYSPSGLIWVKHTAGASRLLGWSTLDPICEDTPVPVSPFTWLVSESGACVCRVEPGAAEIAAGFEIFNRHCLAALVERTRQQDARFSSRLQSRAQADRASVQLAHHALATVLEKSAEAGPGIGGTNPLFDAAKAVGQSIGITIVPATKQRGVSSRHPIENIARASRVRVRRVALTSGWWRNDGGPMVAYLARDGQSVALLPTGPRQYDLFDPLTGTRRRVTAAVAQTLRSHAHSFYRAFPAEKLTIGKLIEFGTQGLKRDAGVIIIAGVLSGLLGLVTPVISGVLFDTVIPSTDRPQLIQIFVILTAAAISTWLLRLVQSMALLRVEGKMDAGLQAAMWDRLLTLPVTFYRGYSAGDLAMRSLSISAMREVLTGSALSAILTGIFSLFSVTLLFHYGTDLALSATGLIVLQFLVTVGTAMFQIRIQRKFAELSGKVAGLLPQLLGGISKIRVAGAEDRAFARWAVRFAEQKRLAVRSRRISTMMSMFFPLFQAATTMVLFYLLASGAPEPGRAGMTTGAFLAFQSAFFQVLAGASQLGGALISVLSVVPLYERAKPILESLPEVTTSKSDPGDITGDIEMSHIAFRYRPDLPLVLKDVSLRIRAGQFVAVVGGTGSGKSTIFRLLLGFENAEAGSIFFDGQDLGGVDVQAIRRQTGVVLQKSGVMGGDIFANIVGSSPLTLDDAWEAARMAGLDEDIRNMPMGMHTVLPDGGLGLSGGQRQRLQIARAVVNRPRLIFFDEATSALDNQTQAVVMESLSRLKATRIVIAHRLSTIRDADCIFVLNHGVIEESGTYDELMANNGFFAELARRQLT